MSEPSPIPESFLLLPGDGLVLVRSWGEVCFLDSTARELMGGGTVDFTGKTLEEAWPELAATVEACAPSPRPRRSRSPFPDRTPPAGRGHGRQGKCCEFVRSRARARSGFLPVP